MAAASTLRVRADTAELSRVRRWVRAQAQGAGLAEDPARRLTLAVDEAMANAIEHGLERAGHVTVRAEPQPRGLTVVVRYRGPRFDPTTAPRPTPGETVRQRASHGYGLHLIRSLADEVAYRWDAGTNEVRLTVRG